GLARDPTVLERVEAAVRRREPDAVISIHVDRSSRVDRQPLSPRPAREDRLVKPFDPGAVADPEVAFAVLEDRRDGRRRAAASRQRGDAVRVDAKQAGARRDPHVPIAIALEGERLNAGKLWRQALGLDLRAVPTRHTAIGSDPD